MVQNLNDAKHAKYLQSWIAEKVERRNRLKKKEDKNKEGKKEEDNKIKQQRSRKLTNLRIVKIIGRSENLKKILFTSLP